MAKRVWPRVPSLRREVIAFVEKFLRIPDGPLAGQPLILGPWQRRQVRANYDNPRGWLRHVISTARKNSKTTALRGRLLLVALYSSGQSRDRVALTFDQCKTVLPNLDLRQIISIKESSKVCTMTSRDRVPGLFLRDPHGPRLNPTLHIGDELSQCVGARSDLFKVLELAMTAQRDPLTVVISTQRARDADPL